MSQSNKSNQQQVYSKVILSGEHSVLRGGLAIVAPFKEHSFSFDLYSSDDYQLELAEPVGPYEILIQGTIEKALSLLEKSIKDFKLKVVIDSIVPLGKGLGGSAALCVFVSKLMLEMNFIKEDDVFAFSKELENIFHGESSGVDIAGCVSSNVQGYIRGYLPKPFTPELKPFLYLSSTDEVGSTEDSIEKVLLLKKEDPELFNALDERMSEASKLVLLGLKEGDLSTFNMGLDEGASVFKAWGLYTDKMKALEARLKEQGAMVVKPTGSGLGGFMLSSWSKKQKLEEMPEGSLELAL